MSDEKRLKIFQYRPNALGCSKCQGYRTVKSGSTL